MKNLLLGMFMVVFGSGAILFSNYVLPRIADQIALQQYSLVSKFFGEKVGRLIQRNYGVGARFGLLLAGMIFIILGLFQIVLSLKD